jgi:hypothetical protein
MEAKKQGTQLQLLQDEPLMIEGDEAPNTPANEPSSSASAAS